MAINKRVYQGSGTNTAAIAQASSFVGAMRVRMSDTDREKYGPCNVFRFSNQSGLKIEVRLGGINNQGGGGSEVIQMEANSTHNINVEDGLFAYDFDVVNNDAANDLAIGNFHYNMARVEQVPER